MANKLTLEERIYCMRIGMSLVGISADNQTVELILKLYDGITSKGSSFNIADAMMIEREVTGSYTKKEIRAFPDEPEPDDKDLLIKAQVEYIELLAAEINDLVGIASAHGWKSSRSEEGIRLYEKMEALREIYNGE